MLFLLKVCLTMLIRAMLLCTCMAPDNGEYGDKYFSFFSLDKKHRLWVLIRGTSL